jgi:hypothetical protein
VISCLSLSCFPLAATSLPFASLNAAIVLELTKPLNSHAKKNSVTKWECEDTTSSSRKVAPP